MLNKGTIYQKKESVKIHPISPSNIAKTQRSFLEIFILWILTALIYLMPWIFLTYTEEYYEITKNSVLLIGISVLIMVWAIDIITKKKLVLYKTPIDLVIFITLAILIISTIFSISPDTSLWGYHTRISGGLISSLLLITIFYLVINTVKTKQGIFFLLKNILFSISSIGLFTILKSIGVFQNIFTEIAKQDPKMEFLNNGLFSPTGNTNALPFLFIMAIPLSFFLYLNRKNAKDTGIVIGLITSIILLVAITITTLSIVPTYFRVLVWAVLLGFLIFNTIYTSKVNKGSLGKLFISICLCLFAIFAFGATSDSTISTKLAEKLNFSRYYDIPMDTSWDVISGTYSKYSIKSFFVGIGPDTYAYAFPQSRPESQNLQPNWFENYTRSNTQIESILVNNGIFGLLGMIIFGYILLNFLFKKIFVNDNWINNRTIFGLGIFIILFIISFFATFHSISFLFIIWLTLGLFFKLFIMLSGNVNENRIEANFKIINNKDPDKSTNVAPYLFSIIMILVSLVVIIATTVNYASEIFYSRAMELTANSKFDESYDNLVYAVNINGQRDYYHKEIASVALSKLDSVVQNAKKDEANLNDQQKSQLVTTQQYLLTLINSEINKAILLNPNNYENWQRAALIYKKLTELSGGTQFGGDTLKAIEESINRNPTNPDNYLLLGYIYQFNSDTTLKTYAQDAYLKAYNLQPTYALSIIQLGSYFEYIGRYSDALQLYSVSRANVYVNASAVNTFLTEKIAEINTKISETPILTPSPIK